jgi:endonuclease YncB( thermonuclease family)
MRAYQIFAAAALLAIGSFVALPATAATQAGDSFTAKVIGIVDGDTLVVQRADESRVAIHLEGVTANGDQAKKFLKENALKQQASVTIIGIDEGKIMAKVELGGKDLGTTLVDAGLGKDTETRRAR